MSALDLDSFRNRPLTRDPFDFVVVPGFVRADALPGVSADFPDIRDPGSYPADLLEQGPRFAALLAELRSEAVADAFAEKFGVDLDDRPTMVTLRGRCQRKDGGIHTDSATKIITALIYMNDGWGAESGRLRLLRSGTDIEDFVVECPPDAGTLLAFRRSERSFHGHLPFEGPRRSIQLNWVRDAGVVRREIMRHRVSAGIKRLNPFH